MKKTPNILMCCQKVGVDRSTVYDWINRSKKFKDQIQKAKDTGNDNINEFTESKLLQKIKDGDGPSIRYRLDRKHPEYCPTRLYIPVPKKDVLSEHKKREISEAVTRWQSVIDKEMEMEDYDFPDKQ